MAKGDRPLNIREIPLSEADRKADARQSLLAGAVGGVAATVLLLVMVWLAWRPARLPEPPTPLPAPPTAEASAPGAPGPGTPAPTPASPLALASPQASPPGTPGAAPPPAVAPIPASPPVKAPVSASPSKAPSPAATRPAPRRVPLPNAYPHGTPGPHHAAPGTAPPPRPGEPVAAPRPAERQSQSDLVDLAVSRARQSSPADPTGAGENNFSYRLSRVVNRSDETLHLSSGNLFLEDAAGRSYPVSRYYSLDLARGQALTEGRDPVVDEQKLTIHFDYLPKDFEPDRLVLDLDSGRVEVRVAGMMLERQSVPSIPTW